MKCILRTATIKGVLDLFSDTFLKLGFLIEIQCKCTGVMVAEV